MMLPKVSYGKNVRLLWDLSEILRLSFSPALNWWRRVQKMNIAEKSVSQVPETHSFSEGVNEIVMQNKRYDLYSVYWLQ